MTGGALADSPGAGGALQAAARTTSQTVATREDRRCVEVMRASTEPAEAEFHPEVGKMTRP